MFVQAVVDVEGMARLVGALSEQHEYVQHLPELWL
jgi:hypothetical protein